MNRRFRIFVTLATLFCALGGSSLALALPSYSGLFVFGDSLADSGNNAIASGFQSTTIPTSAVEPLIPTYPYASNRYSNGPVWVEQLAADLGLSALPSLLPGGTNYAFGGARVGASGAGQVPGLVDQLSMYLAASKGSASPTALYVVEGGGNDARDIINAAVNGEDYASMISDYAFSVASIITRLKTAGAQEILLWNVPDVSKIPYLQWATHGEPTALGQASALVAAMNAALDATLSALLEPSFSGLHVFDAYSAFNDLFNNPLAYGLDDVHSVCSADPACIADPDGVFFWDGIHPTTAGHTILARLSEAELPEPATFFLLFAALLLLAFEQRRSSRLTR